MYNPGCNPPDYLYRSFFSVVEEFMAQAMRLPHYAWLGLAKTIHMYIYTVKLRFLWLHPWVPQSPFQYGQRHRAIQASVHLRVRPAWYSARGAHGREITKYTVICGVHLYTYGFGQPYAHPHVHAHTHQKLHYTNFITVYYTHVCMCALEGGRVSCLSITSTTSTALKTHCRDIALKQHLQRTP